MAIDVGGGAANYGSFGSAKQSHVECNNPANATGTLDTFEVYYGGNQTGVKFGTCKQNTTTNYTMTDISSIGSVTGGSKQTITGLSIDVNSGDMICQHADSDNGLSYGAAIGYYCTYAEGDVLEGTFNMTYLTNYRVALYATGTETAVGHPTIKRFGGIPYAALNRGVF